MTYFQDISDSLETETVYPEGHILFVIKQLEQKAPEPEGDSITFERWDCIRKDEIIDHEEAVRLGLKDYYQQRDGNDLFHDTVGQINESVQKKGWMYNVPQPSVSELEEPITGSDGKMKNYVLRNGRHRYCTDGDYLPCSVISAPHEDFLQKFGSTSNNPDGVHLCNFTSEADATSAIRDWIRKGRLEANVDAVKEYLKVTYPHITPSNRVDTAVKILELEGHRESIRTWKQVEIRQFIGNPDTFNIIDGIDFKNKVIRYISIMNQSETDVRLMKQIMEDMVNPKYDGFSFEVYAALGNRSGRDEEVTSKNVTELRLRNEAKWREFVALACKLAKKKSSGKMPSVVFNWVYQDNNEETPNEFHL